MKSIKSNDNYGQQSTISIKKMNVAECTLNIKYTISFYMIKYIHIFWVYF